MSELKNDSFNETQEILAQKRRKTVFQFAVLVLMLILSTTFLAMTYIMVAIGITPAEPLYDLTKILGGVFLGGAIGVAQSFMEH
jgi:hypothetical protein